MFVKMCASIFRIGLLLASLNSLTCAPFEDLVTDLPGLPSPAPFRHYSGYLNSTEQNHLHYWFVESQSNTSTSDPVVVWLQGGPGCSSILGLLTENGPFRVNSDGSTLQYNEYSWNMVANMLYLESPAGVGYSYTDGGSQITDDNQTAAQNLAAFQTFFEKFPEYANNEFFITGESYGGIYVPTASVLVFQDGNFNFKGFAIGNGMHDWDLDAKTSLINEGYHALYGAKTLENVISYCCPDENILNCDFLPSNGSCIDAVNEAVTSIGEADFNPYYIYDTCPSYMPFIASKLHFRYRKGFKQGGYRSKNAKPIIDDSTCPSTDAMEHWMNTESVRTALHIPQNLDNWDSCGGPPYVTTYTNNTSALYKILLPNVRALLYNGDADTVCNYLHGQYFADGLGLEVIGEYRPWRAEDRTAGFVKTFKNLTFATIMNAGHMVPTVQPAAALQLFTNFIYNLPF